MAESPQNTESSTSPSSPPGKTQGLGARLISGALSIVVFLGLLFLNPYAFAVLVLLIILMGTFELIRITERLNTNMREGGGAAALGIAVLFWLCATAKRPELFGWVAAISLMIGQLVSMFRPHITNFSLRAATNLFTALYVALPMSLLLYIYMYYSQVPQSHLGARLLLFLVVPTWANDTCAYFTGMRWGKNKLAPRISPGKTVEGFFGGMAGSVVLAVLFWWLFLGDIQGIFGLGTAVFVGLMVSVLGPAGDLVESALKREAHLKDSGSFLPGHGGMLDKIDSLMFSSMVYFVLVVTSVPQVMGSVVG